MAVFTGNGSAASPSFTFSSDTNTGMYRVGTDELGLVTNGANALTIDSSQKSFFGPLLSYYSSFSGARLLTNTENTTLDGSVITLGESSAGTANPFTSYFRRTGSVVSQSYGYRHGIETNSFIFQEANAANPGSHSWTEIARFVPAWSGGGYFRLSSSLSGIQFNGDTAAANALDDYEEGSFTPTLLNSGAVPIATSSVNCKYIKIGNQVTCWGLIVTASGVSGSSDPYVVVRGLPKAVGTTSPTPVPQGYGSASQTITSGLDRKPMFVRAVTSFGANDAFLYRGETNFTGGTNFEFVVTYRTID